MVRIVHQKIPEKLGILFESRLRPDMNMAAARCFIRLKVDAFGDCKNIILNPIAILREFRQGNRLCLDFHD